MARQDRLGTRSTMVRREAGTLRVTYHNTDVVTQSEKGRIVLDHGGWMTLTTKTRMNQASRQYGLGYTVRQKDYEWYVDVDGHTIDFDHTPLVIRNGSD